LLKLKLKVNIIEFVKNDRKFVLFSVKDEIFSITQRF